MSELIPFAFEGHPVRIISQSGEPWFVLTDVCKVLEISNSRDAAGRLDDDEKATINTVDLTDSITGCIDPRAQSLTIIWHSTPSIQGAADQPA